MTDVHVHNLKQLESSFIRKLLDKFSFQDQGWMQDAVFRVLDEENEIYTQGYALVAYREFPHILGWAFVRVPQESKNQEYIFHVWPCKKIYAWTSRVLDNQCSLECRPTVAKVGDRPDLMLYVGKESRGLNVGRHLINVAYANFGTLEVYPHDYASRKFFSKLDDRVVKLDSSNIDYYEKIAREIGHD